MPPSLTFFYTRLADYPKFILLQNAIKAIMPSATVTGAAGRPSSFEVVTGEGAAAVLVYSKFATGTFPDFAALAKQICGAAA